jgi:hypothetical protein
MKRLTRETRLRRIDPTGCLRLRLAQDLALDAVLQLADRLKGSHSGLTLARLGEAMLSENYAAQSWKELMQVVEQVSTWAGVPHGCLPAAIKRWHQRLQRNQDVLDRVLVIAERDCPEAAAGLAAELLHRPAEPIERYLQRRNA